MYLHVYECVVVFDVWYNFEPAIASWIRDQGTTFFLDFKLLWFSGDEGKKVKVVDLYSASSWEPHL